MNELNSLIVDNFTVYADKMALDIDVAEISFCKSDDAIVNHYLIERMSTGEQVFVSAESDVGQIDVNCVVSSLDKNGDAFTLTISSEITLTKKEGKQWEH